MKLSERLEALLALAEATDDAERDHNAPDAECVFVDVRPAEFDALLREAAELARRVEDAPVVEIDSEAGEDVRLIAEGGPLDRMTTSVRVIGMQGQRVRIVPEAGLGGGE